MNKLQSLSKSIQFICPLTKERLVREGDYLVVKSINMKYPIVNGIPQFLKKEIILN